MMNDFEHGRLLNLAAMRSSGELLPVFGVGADATSPGQTAPAKPAASPLPISQDTLNLVSTGATFLRLGLAILPLFLGGKK